jgi:hypothetical protein
VKVSNLAGPPHSLIGYVCTANGADDLQVLSGSETPVSVHLLVRHTDFVSSL